MKRPLLAIGLAACLLTATGGSSQAARPVAAFDSCGSGSPVLCTTVVVPLDRAGRHAGSVRLHVEALPAEGSSQFDPRGRVIFLVAGGPGQGSAAAFDLTDYGGYWQSIFPGYTIVAFDDRGTGRSGQLSCPGLSAIATVGPEETARIVGRCGRTLGARGSFYSTRANADDMDAVRAALGVDRITLYGVSYGSKQVGAYALRHGSHVRRIVLDSVELIDYADSFASYSLRAIPGSLGLLCQSTACRGLTRDLGASFASLANRLATEPIVGSIPRPGSRPLRVRVDGLHLIELALDSDLSAGIAAELPAAVSAALAGRPRPLVRLVGLDTLWGSSLFNGINLANNVATECNDADGKLPWPAATTIARRSSFLRAAIAALPKGSRGPFGTWASSIGVAQLCKDWPRPTGAVALGRGSMPDVPVLVLSGDRDIRTPTAEARQVSARFRHGRLLLVPGSGHDVLDSSPCAERFVTAWLAGRPHGSCPRVPLLMAPLGPFPSATAAAGGPHLSPAQTLAVVSDTLREAEATWLATQGLSRRLPGLAGGSLRPRPDQLSFALAGYSEQRGVSLSGVISYAPGKQGNWKGYVTVSGKRAATGALSASAGKLSGLLGGERVSARLEAGARPGRAKPSPDRLGTAPRRNRAGRRLSANMRFV